MNDLHGASAFPTRQERGDTPDDVVQRCDERVGVVLAAGPQYVPRRKVVRNLVAGAYSKSTDAGKRQQAEGGDACEDRQLESSQQVQQPQAPLVEDADHDEAEGEAEERSEARIELRSGKSQRMDEVLIHR